MGLTNNNTYSIFVPERHNQKLSNKICHQCRKEFKLSDEIYFKRTNRAKIYHRKCWEKLMI